MALSTPRPSPGGSLSRPVPCLRNPTDPHRAFPFPPSPPAPRSVTFRNLQSPLSFLTLNASVIVLYRALVEMEYLPDLFDGIKFVDTPFQLTSFALSLLLVFRTDASYGRWWGKGAGSVRGGRNAVASGPTRTGPAPSPVRVGRGCAQGCGTGTGTECGGRGVEGLQPTKCTASQLP